MSVHMTCGRSKSLLSHTISVHLREGWRRGGVRKNFGDLKTLRFENFENPGFIKFSARRRRNFLRIWDMLFTKTAFLECTQELGFRCKTLPKPTKNPPAAGRFRQ